MIISEEKDYFIYGCLSTLFVEGILCILYGCCFEIEHENKYCKMITNCCKRKTNHFTDSRRLITENLDEFWNELVSLTSPTSMFSVMNRFKNDEIS